MKSFPLIFPLSLPPNSQRATWIQEFPGPFQETHSFHQILPISKELRTHDQQGAFSRLVPDNDKINPKNKNEL